MREDRLEAELRAALHRDMTLARLAVDAPQIRARIAARDWRILHGSAMAEPFLLWESTA